MTALSLQNRMQTKFRRAFQTIILLFLFHVLQPPIYISLDSVSNLIAGIAMKIYGFQVFCTFKTHLTLSFSDLNALILL